MGMSPGCVNKMASNFQIKSNVTEGLAVMMAVHTEGKRDTCITSRQELKGRQLEYCKGWFSKMVIVLSDTHQVAYTEMKFY